MSVGHIRRETGFSFTRCFCSQSGAGRRKDEEEERKKRLQGLLAPEGVKGGGGEEG